MTKSYERFESVRIIVCVLKQAHCGFLCVFHFSPFLRKINLYAKILKTEKRIFLAILIYRITQMRL